MQTGSRGSSAVTVRFFLFLTKCELLVATEAVQGKPMLVRSTRSDMLGSSVCGIKGEVYKR